MVVQSFWDGHEWNNIYIWYKNLKNTRKKDFIQTKVIACKEAIKVVWYAKLQTFDTSMSQDDSLLVCMYIKTLDDKGSC